MVDSRLKSISEALANIAVGYPINHTANVFILIPFAPLIADSASKHGAFSIETQGTIVAMGMLFTVVSIVRSYALRRLFEKFGEKENAYTLMVRLFNKIRYRKVKDIHAKEKLCGSSKWTSETFRTKCEHESFEGVAP